MSEPSVIGQTRILAQFKDGNLKQEPVILELMSDGTTRWRKAVASQTQL